MKGSYMAVAKKSPARAKRELKIEEPMVEPVRHHNEPSLVSQKKYWLIAAVLILAGLGYVFRSQFVVASVNGELITKNEYVAALEAQGGKQVLEQLILERLIKAEATKQNVTIPQEEIDTQIATIESNLSAQGQSLDTALLERGMTREQLIEQIRLSKVMELLSSAGTEVTEEEIDAYITENEEMLSSYEDKDELRAMVQEQLQQTKSQEASQTYIQTLQDNAEIAYW
jgi:hypothetical protein